MKVKLNNIISNITSSSTQGDKTHILFFSEVTPADPIYSTNRGAVTLPATMAEASGYDFDTEYEITLTPVP